MSEQDLQDVEAHGLKEAAVAGISAAAMLAGAGAAVAAPTAVESMSKAKAPQSVFKGAAVNKGNAVMKLSDPTLKGEYGIKRGASVNKFGGKS